MFLPARTSNNYRWIIAIIFFTGLMASDVLWFVLSPLLTVIMADLNLGLSQGGLSMSIVCLFVALFAIAGGFLVDRMGVKKSYLFGLLFMAIGALGTWQVFSYGGLFITRVLIGIGFGLCIPIGGVIIMTWFPENERPYMNTINAILPYIATVITFSFTVPMYQALGNSWRMVIVLWGLLLVVVAVAWIIWGKDRCPDNMITTDEHCPETEVKENPLVTVWKSREVRLLSIAETCDMWSFQFLSSMLPTYYIVEVGMSMSAGSRLTAIFPIAGIIAGLVCGVWMTRVGLRRPFMWPMHVMIFVGTLLAINGVGWVRIAGVAMAGFGNAGWAPALFTMPMEFKNMTPSRVGAVYAIMMSMGFMAAFVSPWLGGWLAERISIHHTIFIFSFSSLIAATCTFLMKETGPAARVTNIEGSVMQWKNTN